MKTIPLTRLNMFIIASFLLVMLSTNINADQAYATYEIYAADKTEAVVTVSAEITTKQYPNEAQTENIKTAIIETNDAIEEIKRIEEEKKRIEEEKRIAEEKLNKNIEYLACAIYTEAGGNGTCDECRYRVGDIIMNRVHDPRFPNTIYDVLTQRRQYATFSWTGVVWPARASSPNEQSAIQRAYETARNILTDTRHSELYGAGYVWQAQFIQGREGFWHDGTYFAK